jgi:hypothetical protein
MQFYCRPQLNVSKHFPEFKSVLTFVNVIFLFVTVASKMFEFSTFSKVVYVMILTCILVTIHEHTGLLGIRLCYSSLYGNSFLISILSQC